MTIQELIEALSKFNADTPVVVRGYEGGYNDVTIVKAESIQLNVNTQHYSGLTQLSQDLALLRHAVYQKTKLKT